MHDLVADWKKWTQAERIGASIVIACALLSVLSLPFLAS
jgi:hypothetical protein